MKKLLCGFLLAISALCRGQVGSTDDQPALGSSTLEGNWQLTGDRSLQTFPVLAMMVHVNGTHLTASGDELVRCQGSRQGSGGTLALQGELAADGSFTLEPVSPRVTLQLSITGKVPEAGSPTWAGTYKVTAQSRTSCSLEQSGSFTASQIAPLTGVFTGRIGATFSNVLPSDAVAPESDALRVHLKVEQGRELSHALRTGSRIAYLPLTASLDVTGSPCFQHGVSDPGLGSRLDGDMAQLVFNMDDGSKVTLIAVFLNPDAKGLLLQTATVRGGRCDGQAWYGRLQRGEGGAPGPGMPGGAGVQH